METAIPVSIHRIDASLPLPEYHTPGSVAFDFYARTTVTIPPHTTVKVPTNLIIATPPGYALIIAGRSSLFKKKQLMLSNAIGVIDQDYCGPDDEIVATVYNMGTADTTIERGERFAQGLLVPIARATWNEVDKPTHGSRGGYGSTG